MFTPPIRPFLALAVLLAAPSLTSSGPAGRVGGHVRDASGAPIAHAQVFVVGTSLGAVTNVTGAYSIDSVPVGTYTVRAQFIGYTPAVLPNIQVRAGQAVAVDIVLQPATMNLEAVVVTGSKANGRARQSLPSTIVARGYADRMDEPYRVRREPWNTEEYGHKDENPFLAVSAHPLSTFSIDVDRAGYSNVRRFLLDGQAPPKDAVRIEELVNYFPYDYPGPAGDDPVAIHTELGPAPWKAQHQLLRIGLQARKVDLRGLPPSNLVFLLDVSGSMDEPNKLPLVKASITMLVNNLRHEDRVAIVVYAGSAGLVLPSTPGDEKAKILEAIDRLEAGGSTAGGAGIKRAYDEAIANFIRGGNNRVILATDGDFNVGQSSDAEMVRLIEQKRETGVYLTTLGYGMGNLKDSKLEQIAHHGNGHYAYIFRYDKAAFAGISTERFIQAFNAEGVPTQASYPPLHELAVFQSGEYRQRLSSEVGKAEHGFMKGAFPNSVRGAWETVWLPQPVLLGSEEEMIQVVEAIRKIQVHARDLA